MRFEGLVAALGGTLPAWTAGMTVATGVVLAGAFAADRALGRRVSAGFRAALYGAVWLRLALPVGLASPMGLLGGRAAPAGAVALGEATASQGAPAAAVTSWADLGLGLGYLGVTAALIAVWARAQRRLARQARDARPTGLDAGAPVFVHDTMGPVIARRKWRACVVIPQSVLDGPADALACVLAHERAHLARRDHLVAPVIQLACLFAWPVLPVWIAARRLRTLVEIACDERALAGESREARRRYGEVLVALAQGHPPVRGSLLAPSFGGELRARIAALSTRRRWRKGVQAALVSGAALVAIACSGHGPVDETPTVEAPTPADRPAPGAGGASTRSQSTEGATGQTARAPDVLPGTATVRGSLDKEIIRRIIRRHINEVKFCYEQQLAANPGLGGRIATTFTIGADGFVKTSVLQNSTMNDPKVETCVVEAVRRWEFPKPLGGGIVIVTYPFAFSPSGGE